MDPGSEAARDESTGRILLGQGYYHWKNDEESILGAHEDCLLDSLYEWLCLPRFLNRSRRKNVVRQVLLHVYQVVE
jgi:hypothetical protein